MVQKLRAAVPQDSSASGMVHAVGAGASGRNHRSLTVDRAVCILSVVNTDLPTASVQSREGRR